MPNNVGVDKLSIVNSQSSGMLMAMPDVCLTPAPPAPPIPTPYPNTAQSSNTASGTTTVMVGGNPVCVQDSNFSMSSGDEAGTLGGVMSGVTMGKATFVNYSFDVQFDGKNVCRALDLMVSNSQNTPPLPLTQPPVVGMGGSDDTPKCIICNKDV